MKTILRLQSLLLTLLIGLGLSFSGLAQIYQYSDNSSGTPFAVNSNTTSSSLTRGSGLVAPSTCTASTEGFGASSFVTSSATTIAAADGTGDYVSFTITPKAGYRLNITGFTANLRAPSGGPTAVRYAYNDGAGTLVQNGVSLTPGTSVSCANAGSVEPWASFSPLVTTQTVTFKIFGFNGSGGDLHLKTITVAGTVECNPAIAASIAPTFPSICVNDAVTLTGSVTGSIPSLTHAWTITSGGSFGTLSSPTTNSTNLITGTGAGTVNTQYTATYGSSPSCSVSATKAVIVNPLPALTPNLNPQVCLGTASTNMSYSGVTGTPNVYSLNFDAAAEAAGFVDALNQSFSFGSSGNIPITVPTVSPIAAGSYNATLIVENTTTACESVVYNIVVTVNALPVVSITGASSVCVGSTISLTGNSSPSAVTSSWATSASAVATVSSVGVVSGLTSGNTNITFTSTDGNGCTKTTSAFNVVVNPLPTGTLSFTETSGVANDGTVCSGDAATVTAPSSYANYKFLDGATTLQNGTSNIYTANYISSKSITVEITTAANCIATLSGVSITVGTCGVQNVTQSKNYLTIQAAINHSSTIAGDVITVGAGTYNEAVTVSKAVTIKGANFGTNGCGSRATETIVAGGIGTAFTITSDGVTIDGFNLTGVTGVASTGYKNINLKNNKIDVAGVGLNIGTVALTPPNTYAIENNCINLSSQAAGANQTIGVFLNGVTGDNNVSVKDNSISGSFYGYVFHAVNSGITSKTEILGGTITGVMQGVAVVNTLNGSNMFPSKVKVKNVSMSGFTGTSATAAINFHAGVYGFTGGASTNLSALLIDVDGVTIDGTGKPNQSSAGIYLGDFATAAGTFQTVNVTNSIIQNNKNRGISARGKVNATVINSNLLNNANIGFN